MIRHEYEIHDWPEEPHIEPLTWQEGVIVLLMMAVTYAFTGAVIYGALRLLGVVR